MLKQSFATLLILAFACGILSPQEVSSLHLRQPTLTPQNRGNTNGLSGARPPHPNQSDSQVEGESRRVAVATDPPCDPIRLRVARPAGGTPGPFVLRLKIERIDALDSFDPSFIIDNQADFYPVISIDGQQKGGASLKIDGYDHPEPTDERWTFLQEVNVDPAAANGRDIPITIDVWDSDGGLTFDDDHGDVSPVVATRTVAFTYNSCSLLANPLNLFDGAPTGAAVADQQAHGNGDDDRARVHFRLDWVASGPTRDLPGGAAGVPSTDDLILTEVDVLQVIPHATLVQGKSAVIKIKVQNSFMTAVSPAINVNLVAPSLSVNFTSNITPPLEPGEVRTLFCGATSCSTLTSDFDQPGDATRLPDPILLPYTGTTYRMDLSVTLDPGGLFRPADNASCRAQNDFFRLGKQPVVPTRGHGQFRVAYAPTTSTKVSNLPSVETVNGVRELTGPFIRATWPLPEGAFDPDILPLPIIIPATGIAPWDPVISIFLDLFQDSLVCVDPFMTQIGLSVFAEIAGYDRIVGVVTPDWFRAHADILCSNWNNISGLSTIEMAPHGVLVVPDIMPLAAHELGHTFGLSVDPSLKDWYSFESFPLFTPGAWDEYNLPDPRGKPTEGVWLTQGVSEPAFVQPLLQKRQCNSNCFMGNGSPDTQTNWVNQWNTKKRWIDGEDYHQLIRKLAVDEDPEVLLVTGVITHKDKVGFAPWYRLRNRNIDLQLGSRGTYAFVFLDADGHTLGEAGFTPTHTVPEYPKDVGFTPFSVALPLPERTARVEIVNRLTRQSLGGRAFSANAPTVKITGPKAGTRVKLGQSFVISWSGFDPDGDPLVYTVMASLDGGKNWNLLQLATSGTSLTVSTKYFAAGSKALVRVVVTDGVNTADAPGGPIIIASEK